MIHIFFFLIFLLIAGVLVIFRKSIFKSGKVVQKSADSLAKTIDKDLNKHE